MQYAKYYPVGNRGYGPFRVSEYGLNTGSILDDANERQSLWVQIEHTEAVENVHGIASVPGVDLLFIGPNDLAQSCGHLGDTSHPDVVSHALRAAETTRASGLPAGAALGLDHDLPVWRNAGVSVFTVAADFRFVQAGALHVLTAARDALGMAHRSEDNEKMPTVEA